MYGLLDEIKHVGRDIKVPIPPASCSDPYYTVRYGRCPSEVFLPKRLPLGIEFRQTFEGLNPADGLLLKGFLYNEHIGVELNVHCEGNIGRFYGWIKTVHGSKSR